MSSKTQQALQKKKRNDTRKGNAAIKKAANTAGKIVRSIPHAWRFIFPDTKRTKDATTRIFNAGVKDGWDGAFVQLLKEGNAFARSKNNMDIHNEAYAKLKNIWDTNHPEWYHPNGEIQNFGSLGLNPSVDKAAAIPGSVYSPALVASVEMLLTNGSPYDERNVVSTVYNQRFMQLIANSGRVPSYSKQQLCDYEYLVRALYGTMMHLTRTFAMAFQADYEDTSLPTSLLRAAGAEEFVTEDLGAVRDYLINQWSQIMERYPIQGNIIDRTCWLYGSIFADSCEDKESYYITNFSFYETGSDITRSVGPTTGTFNVMTFDFYRRVINELYVAIEGIVAGTNSQILADYARVYGFDKTIAQEAIKRISMVIPPMNIVYDEFYLKQIQNATLFSVRDVSSDNYVLPTLVKQDEDDISYYYPRMAKETPRERLINRPGLVNAYDDISADEACSLTMLVNTFETHSEDGTEYIVPTSIGSEVAVYINYMRYQPLAKEYDQPLLHTGYVLVGATVTAAALTPLAGLISCLSHMAYHPALYFAMAGAANFIWDFGNYAIASDSSLASLHARAMYAMMTPEVVRETIFTT